MTAVTSPLPQRPETGHELRAGFTVEHRYSVHFTSGALDPENPVLAGVFAEETAAQVLAVVDAGVADAHPDLAVRLASYAGAHPDRMRLTGPPVVLPGGEQCKNDPAHVEAVLAAINDRGLCRHSYVLAIGGGAVLDVAGYAAAIAHRGLRLVRMPTTALAQGDAGIGVKNGVNAFGKKNFVGCFAPPSAVVNDAAFLTTLPRAKWRAGLSEAVKVACLKDPAFFADLEHAAPAVSAGSLDTMSSILRRCAELHLRHIADSGDPFEAGSSRPLDFGHWAAHKLEQLSGFRLGHGEAVGLGVALDTAYAHRAGLLPSSDRRRILALLDALGLRQWAPELALPQLPDGLREFREHLGGRLTITLLRRIGQAVEVHEIDHMLLATAIRETSHWAVEPVQHAESPA